MTANQNTISKNTEQAKRVLLDKKIKDSKKLIKSVNLRSLYFLFKSMN